MSLAEKVNPAFAYFDKPWLLAGFVLPLTIAGAVRQLVSIRVVASRAPWSAVLSETCNKVLHVSAELRTGGICDWGRTDPHPAVERHACMWSVCFQRRVSVKRSYGCVTGVGHTSLC